MSSSTRILMMTIGILAVPGTVHAQTDPTCSSQATAATGYTPGQPTTSGPDGDRVAAAARGAAAGAVVGEVQGDDSRATEIWGEFSRTLQRDQPITFLFWQKQMAAIGDRLQGVDMDVRGKLRTVTDWWIPVSQRK